MLDFVRLDDSAEMSQVSTLDMHVRIHYEMETVEGGENNSSLLDNCSDVNS